MIVLLEGQSFQIKTSSAALTDGSLVYMERGAIVLPFVPINFSISSPTTTPVIPAPGAGISRQLMFMSIRNRDASAEQIVTLIPGGTPVVEPMSFRLLAGDQLMFQANVGYKVCDWQGQQRQNAVVTATQPAVNALNLVTLLAPVTNNNAVANTMQDVTNLFFPGVAGGLYWFDFRYRYTAAATATGSRWSINGPAFSMLAYKSDYPLTPTTETPNKILTAYDMPATANATSATTGANIANVWGWITPSANGNIIGRFASEIALSPIVAQPGSLLQWVRVI